MIQELRVLGALPKDLGSIPAPMGQHITVCNSSSRVSDTFTQTYEGKTSMHIKKRKEKERRN